jgi:hypothetical protein
MKVLCRLWAVMVGGWFSNTAFAEVHDLVFLQCQFSYLFKDQARRIYILSSYETFVLINVFKIRLYDCGIYILVQYTPGLGIQN